MNTLGNEKNSSRKSFLLGALLGATMVLSVFAGGFGPKDAQGSEKVVGAASVATHAGAVEPGWANAETDVLDIQLD